RGSTLPGVSRTGGNVSNVSIRQAPGAGLPRGPRGGCGVLLDRVQSARIHERELREVEDAGPQRIERVDQDTDGGKVELSDQSNATTVVERDHEEGRAGRGEGLRCLMSDTLSCLPRVTAARRRGKGILRADLDQGGTGC